TEGGGLASEVSVVRFGKRRQATYRSGWRFLKRGWRGLSIAAAFLLEKREVKVKLQFLRILRPLSFMLPRAYIDIASYTLMLVMIGRFWQFLQPHPYFFHL